MNSFVVASRAQKDLETIDEYLSERSDDAADRVLDELYGVTPIRIVRVLHGAMDVPIYL